MSTTQAFILKVSDQKFAIPVNMVKFVKHIKKSEIYKKNGCNCILFQEHSIPIYALAELFEKETIIEDENNLTVMILENQDKQVALIVDKLIGVQDIFQKKLVPPIIKIRNINGFTTLSTGDICLIINPYEIIKNAYENNITYSTKMIN